MNVRDWLHVDDHCSAVDLVIDKGVDGEVYNIGGGNEVPNIELTRRILTLTGKPDSLIRPVADRLGHDRRYALDTSKLRVARLGAAARLRGRARLHGRVVQVQPVVVAADQAPGPGLPGLLPGAVLRPHGGVGRAPAARHMTDRPAILITGAAGFAGSHLLDLLGEEDVRVVALRKPGVGAETQAAYPAVAWREVDLLDREAMRKAVGEVGAGRGLPPGRRAARRSVVVGRHRDACGQRHGHARAARRAAPRARRGAGGGAQFGVRLPRRGPRTDRGRSGRSRQPVRHQQDRDGTGGGARRAHRRRPGRRGPVLQPHRPAPGPLVLRLGRRAAGGAHRGGAPGAGHPRRQPREPARLHRRARHGAGVPCAGRAWRAGTRSTTCARAARTGCANCSTASSPARASRSRSSPIPTGSARTTPRCCSAIRRASGTRTGWAPRVPIEQTLQDLLDYWRRAA